MKGTRVISVKLLVLCVAVVGMLIFAKGEDVDDEPGRRITLPPLGGIADYQIGGAYPPDPEVEIVTRDRSQDPVDGVYSICYVNAFQVQPDELAQWERDRPDLVLRGRDGAVVIDADWDEALVDTSSAAARERLMSEVIGPWLTDCASRGFDAVEPDNLDTFTRSGGALTRSDNLALATLITSQAHDLGLAVAQKNTAELTAAEVRAVGFDFAVAEDCGRYSWGEGTECDRYRAIHGGRVIEIEYADGGVDAFERACARADGPASVMLRDRAVVPRGAPGYVYRTC